VRNFRTFREVEEEYFRTRPEEIDDYLTLIFDEYANDGNLAALLASLRVVSRVKGITAMAEEIGMTRKGLQKALSEQGNPKFESISAILQAMGYRLAPQRIHKESEVQILFSIPPSTSVKERTEDGSMPVGV
jgi:probable addiction module antidote protein